MQKCAVILFGLIAFIEGWTLKTAVPTWVDGHFVGIWSLLAVYVMIII